MKTLTLTCICFSLFRIAASAQIWMALDQGLNNYVMDLATLQGDLYAVGKFTDAGGDPEADYIARWDGSQWHAVAPGLNKEARAIAFSGDTIYVGGSFTDAGGVQGTRYIAYWAGGKWNAMDQGLKKDVATIAIKGNEVYAGGWFYDDPDGSMNYIARWDGHTWNAIGNGFEKPVSSIVADGEDIYAGGGDPYTGGLMGEEYILKWNGQSWLPPGQGLSGMVLKIRYSHGQIYAVGLFEGHVASWNKTGWTNYELPSIWGEIMDIAVAGDEIYVVGWDEGVYRWNGIQWNLILDAGNSLPDDFATIHIHGNDLYLGGIFDLDLPGTRNIAWWKNSIFTSIQYESGPSLLKVSPNPCFDVIRYDPGDKSPGRHKVILTDMNGKILVEKLTEVPELHIADLPAGLYILKVQNGVSTGVAKIMKG